MYSVALRKSGISEPRTFNQGPWPIYESLISSPDDGFGFIKASDRSSVKVIENLKMESDKQTPVRIQSPLLNRSHKIKRSHLAGEKKSSPKINVAPKKMPKGFVKISDMIHVDSEATPGDDQSCPMSSVPSKSNFLFSSKDRVTLETPRSKAQ
jgi:hypothetical protein